MDDLFRELAPVTASAWEEIESEARRTFERHIAGRRVVDVNGPLGAELSAVGTGHLSDVDPPAEGVNARLRRSQPIVELKVPFSVDRQAIEDVERGAKDSDWQPVKDAATRIAFAEDRALFEGYSAAGIDGLRQASSGPVTPLPDEVRDYPDAISQAISRLRLAGVNGPYSVLLSAAAYTAVNETADQGYPVRNHLSGLVDGEIVWAPAIDGAFVMSTRGGDFELHLGRDLSIGYSSHDETAVSLYFYETLTFIAYTAEAVVALA